MISNLLIRLLIAHLLSDFFFQPISWIKDRKMNKIRSWGLIYHIILTTLLAYIFSGKYDKVWIPLVIFISHYLIDLGKSYLHENIKTFLIDQVLHILVLLGIWIIVGSQWIPLELFANRILGNTQFWLVILGYLFVTWPLGIFIGMATQPWRNEIDENHHTREGLANAGKWIGICERALILTFILTNQYTSIGFLITAKSILRFGEKDKNTSKKTEYILVGTLLSFTFSTLIGILIGWAYIHLGK